MSGANITLKDIIERKIAYAKEEKEKAEPIDFSVTDPYDISYEDFISMQNGEIRALNEMLEDIQIMSEDEFTGKYLEIVKILGEKIEAVQDKKYEKIADAKACGTDVYEVLRDFSQITEETGYNNAIVGILILFDRKNEFFA